MLRSTGRATPLAVRLSSANRHDNVPFHALVDAVPLIKRPSGQRRKRPAKLHADKAYDVPRRRALARLGMTVQIAARGSTPASG